MEGYSFYTLKEFFQAGFFLIVDIAEDCPHKTEALCLHLWHTK